jgi:NADH-quinone oxidoreductase subunit C
MPNHEEVLKELKAQFGDKIQSSKVDVDTLIIDLESGDHAYNVLNYLQNDSTLKLNFLTTLCGLHFPDQSGAELGVMYQVKNLVTGYGLRLKSYFPIAHPKIKSVTSLFPSANWMERQEYDFFGIEFEGHPDLRRILNVDEMDYFPMRKEYRLEDAARDDKEDKYFGR